MDNPPFSILEEIRNNLWQIVSDLESGTFRIEDFGSELQELMAMLKKK